MENKLKLEIVTPYGLILSDEVDEVTTSGSEGEFGVLPGHVHFITTLKIGMLTYKKGTEVRYVFVNGGYAEVERAKAAMKRAEERLKKMEEIDFARAETALERAAIRTQVAEKRTMR
jgi:F-type H+-transporting ATPase subunit epsilon